MPFIPHTDADIQAMLDTIGVDSIEDLFDEIPAELRCERLRDIGDGLTELQGMRLMQSKADKIRRGQNFVGAGAYEHHIPAAVWDITMRGEFLTAYTPYQAEASQGTLQLLYEYQTMMASLMGMEVANASLYDGASALAEAVLMAVRVNRKSKSKKILVAGNLHPHYRETVQTIVSNQHLELVDIAYDRNTACLDPAALDAFNQDDITAVVVAQPNFFGGIEAVDSLTDWAHERGALLIASVNPIAMSLLKEPGSWGQNGADIVCGEGQPLGVPLASGGPYFGFLCCRLKDVRQMPGRLIGRTVDQSGKTGYTLTLQAREQHIRRSKATSNICTNQGLLVTAATIYMSLLGFDGLQRVAKQSHFNTKQLVDALCELDGVERIFSCQYFHEAAIRLPVDASRVLEKLVEHDIHGGVALAPYFSELDNGLLVCATETKTPEDLIAYQSALKTVLNELA